MVGIGLTQAAESKALIGSATRALMRLIRSSMEFSRGGERADQSTLGSIAQTWIEVEAVEIHDLVPRSHEGVHERLL